MLQYWCVLSRISLFLKWTRRKNQEAEEGSNLVTMEAIIPSSRTSGSDAHTRFGFCSLCAKAHHLVEM